MTVEEMKARKRELGYSNDRISQVSGVPLGTVQKIFSGETVSPRYSTIKKLEYALGKSDYEYIFKEIENSNDTLVREVPFTASGYSADIKWEKSHSYRGADILKFQSENAVKRIGVAAGKFKVPDDVFFYDDEIAESFEKEV